LRVNTYLNNELTTAMITTDPNEKLSKIFKKIITKLLMPANKNLYLFRVYMPDYDTENFVISYIILG